MSKVCVTFQKTIIIVQKCYSIVLFFTSKAASGSERKPLLFQRVPFALVLLRSVVRYFDSDDNSEETVAGRRKQHLRITTRNSQTHTHTRTHTKITRKKENQARLYRSPLLYSLSSTKRGEEREITIARFANDAGRRSSSGIGAFLLCCLDNTSVSTSVRIKVPDELKKKKAVSRTLSVRRKSN